jgi:hypothetical protein
LWGRPFDHDVVLERLPGSQTPPVEKDGAPGGPDGQCPERVAASVSVMPSTPIRCRVFVLDSRDSENHEVPDATTLMNNKWRSNASRAEWAKRVTIDDNLTLFSCEDFPEFGVRSPGYTARHHRPDPKSKSIPILCASVVNLTFLNALVLRPRPSAENRARYV